MSPLSYKIYDLGLAAESAVMNDTYSQGVLIRDQKRKREIKGFVAAAAVWPLPLFVSNLPLGGE